MKKSFLYFAIAACVAVCAVSCGSDDEVATPPAPEQLPLPVYSAQAATYSLADSAVVSSNGAVLKSMNFTESGKAIFEISVNGKTKYVSYDMVIADGKYTIKDKDREIGMVQDLTSRTSSNTTVNLTITIIIDGVSYVFSTSDPVSAVRTANEMAGSDNLNNIARTWTVQSMFLELEGDVSLSKLENSGNLEVFLDEALKRNVKLDENEKAQLKRTVNGFIVDKNGNFIIEYTEHKDGSTYAEVASWTWNGNKTDELSFKFRNSEYGNKFLSDNSTIKVEFNAAGGCTFSLSTDVSGSQKYKANLIVVLK